MGMFYPLHFTDRKAVGQRHKKSCMTMMTKVHNGPIAERSLLCCIEDL